MIEEIIGNLRVEKSNSFFPDFVFKSCQKRKTETKRIIITRYHFSVKKLANQ